MMQTPLDFDGKFKGWAQYGCSIDLVETVLVAMAGYDRLLQYITSLSAYRVVYRK